MTRKTLAKKLKTIDKHRENREPFYSETDPHQNAFGQNGRSISRQNSVECLGVELDSKLTFNQHANESPTTKARRIRDALYPIVNNNNPVPVRAKIAVIETHQSDRDKRQVNVAYYSKSTFFRARVFRRCLRFGKISLNKENVTSSRGSTKTTAARKEPERSVRLDAF